MPRSISPIRGFLLASVLVLVPSCGGHIEALPPAPPADVALDQRTDTRPVYPVEAATSEAAHERWTDDTMDWGDRRNLLAYRWCEAWNRLVSKVDCGPKPEGVP